MPTRKPKRPCKGARCLRRKRWDGSGGDGLLSEFVAAVADLICEGRVPLNIAEAGLDMLLDEVRDQIAARGVSFAKDPTALYCMERGNVDGDLD